MDNKKLKYTVTKFDGNQEVMSEQQLKDYLSKLSFNKTTKTNINFINERGDSFNLTGHEAYVQLNIGLIKNPKPLTKK